MKIIDEGHCYRLHAFDGTDSQTLTFVKRCTPAWKYPGNVGSHPGTINQEVLRALIHRTKYVNGQSRHWVNPICVWLYRAAITLLELRVMQKKRKFVRLRWDVENQLFCSTCGHFVCEHGAKDA